MSKKLRKPVLHLLAVVAPAAVAMAMWTVWLGWDQRSDVHADGSMSGPYEAWQVIGLGVSLLPLVYWAASRGRATAGALGTSSGLAVAAYYDWSDDSSGLFGVGVSMVMIGSLVATGILSVLITSSKRRAGVGPPGP